MNLKRNTIALLILINATTSSAQTCDEVLTACDRALNFQIEMNEAQRELLVDMESLNRAQADLISQKNNQLEAWYRNPFVVGGVGISVGVILGAAIVNRLSR